MATTFFFIFSFQNGQRSKKVNFEMPRHQNVKGYCNKYKKNKKIFLQTNYN